MWYDLNFKKHEYETMNNTVCGYNTDTNDVIDIFHFAEPIFSDYKILRDKSWWS